MRLLLPYVPITLVMSQNHITMALSMVVQLNYRLIDCFNINQTN
uniref:Uncharacterized protein n=1 Tax=Anguilla anguilla TaxID=7936 RepID=A0A0E9QJF8_ANGAN